MRHLYPDVNPWDLEPHYSRHVAAMTAEGLEGKAAIAEQLAWRDARISALETELADRDGRIAELEALLTRWTTPKPGILAAIVAALPTCSSWNTHRERCHSPATKCGFWCDAHAPNNPDLPWAAPLRELSERSGSLVSVP